MNGAPLVAWVMIGPPAALTFIYLPAAIAIYLAMLIFIIVSIDITLSAGATDTERSPQT
jgi:hypothetical protein